MAEVGSVSEAEEVRNEVTLQIEQYTAIEEYDIEPYWKIPAYYEIALTLRPYGDPDAAYAGLIGLAEEGWTSGGSLDDRWAVWNPTPEVRFLSIRIKWAQLQLWHDESQGEVAA